jgi:hypothetical protein
MVIYKRTNNIYTTVAPLGVTPMTDEPGHYLNATSCNARASAHARPTSKHPSDLSTCICSLLTRQEGSALPGDPAIIVQWLSVSCSPTIGYKLCNGFANRP